MLPSPAQGGCSVLGVVAGALRLQPPEQGFLGRPRREVLSEIAASKEELLGICNVGSRRCQPAPRLSQKTQPCSPGWQQRGAQTKGKACFHLILVSQGRTPLPDV